MALLSFVLDIINVVVFCLNSPSVLRSGRAFFPLSVPGLSYVPEIPGNEATLLLYSIMNEGSFEPAHSSLLQRGTLSCQPHSSYPPPTFMTLLCLYVRVPRKQQINGRGLCMLA